MSYPVIKGTLQSSQNYIWNTADSLGRGATAIVYLGREKTAGRVVAVKVFHEHLRLSHGSEVELRELRMLQGVNHDNIIRFLAIEQELRTSKYVLVMEYCEGGSLYNMLDQPANAYGLPEDEFLLVVQHVAAGIEYLRRRNIVHRDIKPGNIMRFITEEGKSVYKLTDFGAARELQDEENYTSLYGTEEYLNPALYEQAVLRKNRGQAYGAQTDLWSIGVTYYHVATGQLPFRPYGGRSNPETMYSIISKKDPGVISGFQDFCNGPIHYSRQLPGTCLLSPGLKVLVTPLLAGLMENSSSRMLNYDDLFQFVRDLTYMIPVTVFHYNACTDLRIYIHRQESYSKLQDLIASCTDIPASKQLLLTSFNGQPLSELVDVTAMVETYPAHLLSGCLYLIQLDMPEAERLTQPEIPPFPEFVNYVDIDKDARLAHSCVARSHLIKTHTERTVEQQEMLVQGELCFRTYVRSRLQAVESQFQLMTRVLDISKKRVAAFYLSMETMRVMLESLNRHREAQLFGDVSRDRTLQTFHKKAEDRIASIQAYKETIAKKQEEFEKNLNQWTANCRQQKCPSKIAHLHGVILNINNRFARDKNVREQMTAHDQTVHQFERVRLQEQCLKVLSTYQGHCLQNLDIMYRQSQGYIGQLSRCLGRIEKVEQNVCAVINCQQQVCSKLDERETRCKSTMEALREELNRGRVALSDSRMSRSGASILPSGDFSLEVRSLREESLELESLLKSNMEMMQSLGFTDVPTQEST